MRGVYNMRAFYTDPSGFTADLCKHLYKDNTRLTVRDSYGRTTYTHWHLSWDDAIAALREMLPGCVNDLTHKPID